MSKISINIHPKPPKASVYQIVMAGALLHVDFIETSRGGRHLLWNGYTYRQNNKRDTWISWKCTQTTCRATICTRDDIPCKMGQPHNHLPNQAAVEGRRILNTIRSRAKEELTPLPSIYDEEITKLRDAPWDAQTRDIAANLPTFHSSKSSLYRSRQKTQPPVPTIRANINLEGKFRQTTSGEPFLQAEDGDINKILIFTTTDNITHLSNADRIYCDGTFYTAPRMFDSIFTIHAFVGTAMFPLVFTLLPARDTATYVRLFTLLKEICQRHNKIFSPTSVSLDFECASRNATTQTFHAAELKGCLFHYCKAIWKKTQECGLQRDYKDIPDVNRLVRRAAALPLLPLDKVEDYWLHALEDAPNRDDCTKLADYVTETWIEGRYPLPTWNHYQTEGPRTNNHLEGWHNKLKKRVKTPHPSIFKIIDIFKKEQAANEVKIEQYAAGGKKRLPEKKYREIEERLHRLKTQLTCGEKNYIQYGDTASYILKLD